jgi:hypothetical protein
VSRNVAPLGDGQASHLDADTIEATFPMTVDMDGWRMTVASVDETGYFLTIRWEREPL